MQRRRSWRWLAATALCTVTASGATADSWRYGVLTDTQGAGAYPDVSTRLMTPVVDRFVNEHRVDMLLSVGDLSDRGSEAEFDLWNQTAQPLFDAGIPVYATRGNHDVKTETTFEATDPLFGSVDVRNTDIWDAKYPMPSDPSIVQGPGASYMFSYENAFFVAVDVYGAPPTELINWVTDEALPAAATSGAEHRVLFQHEPYFGKARSGVLSADPSLELDLLSGMAAAGIDSIYVGHDHQYSRSVALDETGDVLLNHLVTGSNAEKYYRYEEAPGPNEGQVVQINDRVGYSIVDVDGPLISWTHYQSEHPDPATTDPWTPDWEVADRMVYATNGDQYFVEPGGSFAGLSSTSDNGTHAAITDGTNDVFDTRYTDPDPGDGEPVLVALGEQVNFAWVDGGEDGRTIGDILVLDGLANDPAGVESEPYTLQLHYNDGAVDDESLLMLAYLDESTGRWVRATEGNFPMGPVSEGPGGAYSGVDVDGDYVWATLNHNAPGTRFAVVAVPEPTTLALLGLTGLTLLRRRIIRR